MESITLPDDVLYHFMNFLNPVDCILLSFSGVFDRFSMLYGQKRTLDISCCFNLSPLLFEEYTTRLVSASAIQIIDFSHCYWFSPDLFLNFIAQCSNLTELYIHDTKLTLVDCTQVFPKCPKITHFSVDLSDLTWEKFHTQIECSKLNHVALQILREAFKKLTRLKLFNLDATSVESWLLTLTILGWCQNCIDVHLEPVYTEDYYLAGPFRKEDLDTSLVEFAETELLPKLQWMEHMKSFVYVKRGLITYPDPGISLLCDYIFQKFKPQSLERFWINCTVHDPISYDGELPCLLSSISLGDTSKHCEINENLLPNLTHVGGIQLTSLSRATELKFVRSFCTEEEGPEALDEFCQLHERLEHLFLEGYFYKFTLQREWQLPHLRTLVYTGVYNPDAFVRMIHSCPNLEEIHIGNLHGPGVISMADSVETTLEELEHLSRLKKLSLSSIELRNGRFLEKVFLKCSRLESLHISGHFDKEIYFHRDMCSFLHLTKNLKDIRLHWDYSYQIELIRILNAISQCRKLERLVIYQEKVCKGGIPDISTLPAVLSSIVSTAKNLVVLCMALKVDRRILNDAKKVLNEIVSSLRISFWFHIDRNLPKAGDPNIPRIHYDDIIHPIKYNYSPPKFEPMKV